MSKRKPKRKKQVYIYSGKTLLRMPRSLHASAARYAQLEGISLNQFICYALAEKVGSG